MKISVQKNSQIKKGWQTKILFTALQGPTSHSKIKIKASKDETQLAQSEHKQKNFKSQLGECLFFRSKKEQDSHLLFVGLGDSKSLSYESLRRAAACALKKLHSENSTINLIDLDSLSLHFKKELSLAQALTEGLVMGEYHFDNYKTKADKKGPTKEFLLSYSSGAAKSYEQGLQAGQIIAESVNFSRVLGDTPGNLMTPTILAKEVESAAKNTKIKVTIWDKARIKKEKMGGLMGVALGSDQDPRFIIMEYKGAPASKKPICLVGKGLTFDSGGISIKPAQSMDEMKYDMCGGANVIGAILAIAKLKLKVNVKAYIPSTENMSGGSATKPGDILTIRNGKTVEVLNTDAEGRLILADALCVASEQKPQAIFDMATLTGAMVIALSNIHTGIFGNNDKLVDKVKQAGKESGELIWHMPLHSEHTKDIKGRHADLQNIGATRGAGSSTAAAFLQEFVADDIPWVHFDIAGTGWSTSNRLEYNPSKSASGVMIRTLVELAKKF